MHRLLESFDLIVEFVYLISLNIFQLVAAMVASGSPQAKKVAELQRRLVEAGQMLDQIERNSFCRNLAESRVFGSEVNNPTSCRMIASETRLADHIASGMSKVGRRTEQ